MISPASGKNRHQKYCMPVFSFTGGRTLKITGKIIFRIAVAPFCRINSLTPQSIYDKIYNKKSSCNFEGNILYGKKFKKFFFG